MGLRSSKHSPTSYDIAPVVSNEDFNYTRTSRQLPPVVLPSANANAEELQQNENGAKTNIVPPIANKEALECNTEAADVQENENAAKTNDNAIIATPIDSSEALESRNQEIKTEADKAEVSCTSQSTTNGQDEISTMNSHIPDWVNKHNFEPLLQKRYPTTFKEIISFEAHPALAAGENYATLMLRVKLIVQFLDDSTENLSYMLKVPHDTIQMKEMLQQVNFFNTENSVYNEIIPEIEQMYRDAGVTIELAPKSYRMSENAPSEYYVLLDDLKVRGFKNVNRLDCLDMEHTLAVLKKLAQLHAASVCRVVQKGPYPPSFSPEMDNAEVRQMLSHMFGSLKKPFMDNLPTYKNGERYMEKMDKFFDNLIEVFIKSRKLHPNNLNVMNHGDAWSNNILFNYTADGKLKDVMFVDFQNTHYSSLAQDVFYFIVSSVRIDIKLDKFDYFIRYYHEHLVENLKLLKYPGSIPNLRELHMQLADLGIWATVTTILTLGVILLDPTDSAKFENFMAQNQEAMEFKQKIFSNPRYIKYVNEILPWLCDRGFMDVSDLDSTNVATDKAADTLTATTTSNDCVPAEFSAPKWVNESYFGDIIHSDFENYQKILKFTVVCLAGKASDNSSSKLLQVDIQIELTDHSVHTVSYMLKIPPAAEESVTANVLNAAFQKEITAYNEILPRFVEAYRTQAGHNIIFGPKSYKEPNSQDLNQGNNILILQNIKCTNVKDSNGLEGLDKEHTKAVLKKLAEFHAASAYVYQSSGKCPAIYEKSICTKENSQNRKANIEELYNIFYNCAKDFKGTKEYIGDLKICVDKISDFSAQAHTVDDTKLNVLNHGDCSLNNIAFEYDDVGNIAATYLMNFEHMRYGSPACDLYYFLFTSIKFDLKLEYFDYFIRYYHENLQTNLELLKYSKSIPTLRELHMELLDQGAWAFYAATAPMAVTLFDPTNETISLELLLRSDASARDLKEKIFSHERYRVHAEAIFPWMSQRGMLNVN